MQASRITINARKDKAAQIQVPLRFDCRNNTSPLDNLSKVPIASDSIFQCNGNNSTDLSTGISSRCQETHQVHPHPTQATRDKPTIRSSAHEH